MSNNWLYLNDSADLPEAIDKLETAMALLDEVDNMFSCSPNGLSSANYEVDYLIETLRMESEDQDYINELNEINELAA